MRLSGGNVPFGANRWCETRYDLLIPLVSSHQRDRCERSQRHEALRRAAVLLPGYSMFCSVLVPQLAVEELAVLQLAVLQLAVLQLAVLQLAVLLPLGV